MITPSFRLPLAVVALAIVVLGAWRLTGGRPLSLPGDIRYEGEGFRVHFPWVSCLLLSAVGNVLMWAFQGRGRSRARTGGGAGGGGEAAGGGGAGGCGTGGVGGGGVSGSGKAGHRP